MLIPGTIVFINFPEESNHRILHAAVVMQNNANGLVIRSDEPGLRIEAGQSLRLYFEKEMKFVQQAARIESVIGAASQQSKPSEVAHALAADDVAVEHHDFAMLVVRPLGQPVSAESRECYRVSTITAGLDAEIEDEAGCVLADVSVTGFSIISHQPHPLGSVRRIRLNFENNSFAGEAAIQSIKDLGGGRYRYGFLCADSGAKRTPLRQGLQQISVAVQRRQLKRLSGQAA